MISSRLDGGVENQHHDGMSVRRRLMRRAEIFDMRQKYADVASLIEVLEYLAAWRARPAQKQRPHRL